MFVPYVGAVVKHIRSKKYQGRLTRQLTRFDQLMLNPHPPIKGVPARKTWKNVSMTIRLRVASARRASTTIVSADAHAWDV